MKFASSFALLIALAAGTPVAAADLRARLGEAAPELSMEVLELALAARACAAASGVAPLASRMAVIDYSLPSTERRLWVFDLDARQLLFAEHVAHGQGSGGNIATAFSNVEGSHQTSLGLFLTDDTYYGGNGYSLRMDGLDPGINDRARQRYIVMHGAPYVDPEQALRQGRLGRSHGCPAVRPQVAHEIIDTLRDGQLIFAYYPDPEWLAQSPHLGCTTPLAGGGGGSDALASP
ncbi:MAG TPA: murein L,D-transpeptidase catalytic domain family protein [Xanthomonadaceae bacterium]|nr:murein L,D-transpeptidase catalytic domain family protein [Xanthomonadaceae bacterium]